MSAGQFDLVSEERRSGFPLGVSGPRAGDPSRGAEAPTMCAPVSESRGTSNVQTTTAKIWSDASPQSRPLRRLSVSECHTLVVERVLCESFIKGRKTDGDYIQARGRGSEGWNCRVH